MSSINELIDRYITIWNETDANRRSKLISETWTESSSYVDPVVSGEGQSGINAMIQGVQTQFPGHQFRLVSDIESHHDRVRFQWELTPEGGPAIVRGTDFGIVAGDGRLQAITGFFDEVRAAAA